ncbi:MaoC family dehydratase [Roseateles sp. BYS180W]|uniref:MaoC family dehydratase n=1 Tax=Roseateles rivi TaxID=3299028 RepID=A0ABW7FWD2_9BURK
MYFEEIPLGRTRRSCGRTLTEADLVLHAGQTGDFFPHHMDVEFMRQHPFGQRVAHGTLVFSIGVGQGADEINEHAFSYGYDKLRFIKPVFIGDTLTTEFTITEKEDVAKRPGHGLVRERTEVRNQHGHTVLACEHLYLVVRRHALTLEPQQP